MGSHRRRHHVRCSPISLASGVTVISAACLVLFVFVSILAFLAPPLSDHPAFPRRPSSRLRHSRLLLKNPVELQTNVVLAETFSIPSEGIAWDDLWGSKLAKDFDGCSNASREFKNAEAITAPDRFLMIATSGGLNQQRTGITDAVVAARILKATLVVPTLDQNSFWKDASNFTEIFDVDWFIKSLSKDVKIVKELPQKGGRPIWDPCKMRVPRKCNARCYESRVLPVLKKKHVVRLTKFDYRLSNMLETDLQKLRCRVNYHALRFTYQIRELGETLVHRMRAKSKHFIALHLRFESDMLAFSGCYYGGGDKERKELGTIRKRWKTLHASNPDKERRHGKCPLTPEEVGLMLRALGFGKDVHIYVASGEVYGGEETLAPLRALFPNFHSKDTLASKEELAPLASFSSRMAALDYIVCDESDVFVTNNNGNMAKMLAGRRRYFGHKRTIRPNAKKLFSLFTNRTQMTSDEFSSKVRTVQEGFMGEPNEIKPGRGEFHENPFTCICEKGIGDSGSRIQTAVGNINGNDNSSSDEGEQTEYHWSGDEVLDWNSLDDEEVLPLGKSLSNGTEPDYDLLTRPEDPWEEIVTLSE